jgi:hypothetical protein
MATLYALQLPSGLITSPDVWRVSLDARAAAGEGVVVETLGYRPDQPTWTPDNPMFPAWTLDTEGYIVPALAELQAREEEHAAVDVDWQAFRDQYRQRRDSMQQVIDSPLSSIQEKALARTCKGLLRLTARLLRMHTTELEAP